MLSSIVIFGDKVLQINGIISGINLFSIFVYFFLASATLNIEIGIAK